jgi:GAF domain-containing protein
LATIQAVAEQVALALDAARLARETERAAWRDRVVSESTASLWASAELDEVMKAAVAQLGDKLRASEVVIRLGTEAELPRE